MREILPNSIVARLGRADKGSIYGSSMAVIYISPILYFMAQQAARSHWRDRQIATR
jgi:hypothetical protein